MSKRSVDSAFAPKKMFREIRWEVTKAILVNEVLNAAILFFALNILLTIFNMSFFVSLVPAIIFFVWRMVRSFKKQTVRKLEEGNPEIFEILRTAYDHKHADGLMVQGMMYDLQKKLSTVSAGVLLKPKRIFVKLAIVAAVAFIPIMIISVTPFLIQENPFEDVNFGEVLSGEDSGVAIKQLFGIELNESDDIYGAVDVLELGNEELAISVREGSGSVNFDEVSNPEEKDFTFNDYPEDVSVQSAEAGSGGVYEEADLTLINDYSCRTRGACPQQ